MLALAAPPRRMDVAFAGGVRRRAGAHSGVVAQCGPECCVEGAGTSAPATAEIEALFTALVDSYGKGRLDAFAALFDDDVTTNLRHGRAAIRSEYDALFRLSEWRRRPLKHIHRSRAGVRAIAKGEIAVKTGGREGREVEQRVAVNIELVRQDGRIVVDKVFHQPRN